MEIANNKGFTLIELMIVVAIIAILVAIAAPQFSAFKVRGYNGAALSDIRHAKTAEESMFIECQGYGKSQGGPLSANWVSLIAATNTTGPGELLAGPVPAATETVAGAMISGPAGPNSRAVGIGLDLSNGVSLVASSMSPASPSTTSPSYIIVSKHTGGDKEFAVETESTSIMYVQNDTWRGQALTAAGAPAAGLNAPTTGTDITNTAIGGGVPVATWSSL